MVRAVVGAALSDGADRAVMNVGTGSEITVNELAGTIVEVTGGKSTIKHAEGRAGEILRSVARVDRIEKTLGWKAQVALRDGLANTLRG